MAGGNIIATIMTTQIAKNSEARMPVVDDAVRLHIDARICHTSTAQAAAGRAKSKPKMALR